MKARVKWVEARTFAGESGSGHLVMMDGAPESGGRNLAARPMELLLLGMGGCSAFDVVMILEKAREKITDCVVELEAVRADTDPKVFTKIDMHFIVTGKALKHARVEQAVSLSAEKYCSASIMLGKTAEITHRFSIIEA
jgi:putative redox protein